MIEKNEIGYTGISVVVPCYNCEKTIERCLSSLTSDINSSIEILLVNDCSTDNTDSVIRKYIKSKPTIDIRYFCNEKNLGAGETRNRGIQLAKKEYLVFVDADDTIDGRFFSLITNHINEYHDDCIIFNADYISAAKTKPFKMFYGGHFKGNNYIDTRNALVFTKGCTCGKVYKTEIIKSNDISFASIKRNEDCVFTKIALSFCDKIYYIDDVLYHYYDNPDSLMNNEALLDKNNAFIAFGIISSMLENRGFENELHSIYMIEIIYSTTTTCLLQNNNYKENYNCVSRNYKFNDRYYFSYSLKYRLAIRLFRLGLINAIAFLLRFRNR